MSLDKAIASGKENRKPYRKGKSIARSCRNHGGCEICLQNRNHAVKKAEMKAMVKE